MTQRFPMVTLAAFLPSSHAGAPDDSTFEKVVDFVFIIITCGATAKRIDTRLGTGVLVDAEQGLILTAYHFIVRRVLLHPRVNPADHRPVTELIPAFSASVAYPLRHAPDAASGQVFSSDTRRRS